MPLKLLPPDADQIAMAKEINRKLSANTKLTFYRTQTEEAETKYGAVFEYGTARKNILSSNPFCDSDQVVHAIEAWVRGL
jgi:hypothetical protein